MSTPIPQLVLPDLAAPHLSARQATDLSSEESYETALAWATRDINPTVALLQRVGPDAFIISDYALDLLSDQAQPIPDATWPILINHADPPDLVSIGFNAYVTYGQSEVAREAWSKAAISGHADAAPDAAVRLGDLLAQSGDVAGARAAYQQAIDSGHADAAPDAAVRLGDLLAQSGDSHSVGDRPVDVTEIALPFFGSTGSGKTRLLLSMVMQLQIWAAEGQLTVEFDSATKRELDDAYRILRADDPTVPTSVRLPQEYRLRFIYGKSTRILHMFDAAGEVFYRSDRSQDLEYLSGARTFIFVIDPLSVEAFWRRLPVDRQAVLESARSVAPSPDLAYQQASQQMEAIGARLRTARLAIVFSRADLIDMPSSDVAGWATSELGLGNLVLSAQHDFREISFFRTSAVMGADGVIDESVATLTRWVLSRDGVYLPGAAQ